MEHRVSPVGAAYGRTQYILNLISLLSLLPALFSMLRMQSVYLTDETSADAVVVMGRAEQLNSKSSSCFRIPLDDVELKITLPLIAGEDEIV